MAETADQEVDVGQLMAEIRAAVARREAEGRKSILSATLDINAMLARAVEPESPKGELPPIQLQPEFVQSPDDHYHVNDLLQYHDHAFVWNAYRAVLKREPDEEGLRQFLKSLRSGRLNKIDVLASLRFSPEGRSRGVRVDGLKRPALFRRLYRVPVLGYLLELLAGVARLPAMIHGQRQFEAHAVAQQERLALHVNQLSRTSFQIAESFSRELSEVSEESRRLAELQREQVVGLFREQRETARLLKELSEEVGARLRRLDEVMRAGGAHVQPGERAPAEGKPAGLDELLAALADEFRGTREEVKEGLRFYLPLLKSAGVARDVLDLGCGRGEWLELLKEEGIEARGVEANRVAAGRARRRGLEVFESDALGYLRGLPGEGLAAVTAFHLVEHLPFAALVELLDEIARTLRPGGLVIFETPNPKNLVVGACNFHSDPTHLRPLFPETLQFVMGRRGFADIRVEYLNPVAGSPFGDDTERSRALDTWLYGPRDFAVIGRKA